MFGSGVRDYIIDYLVCMKFFIFIVNSDLLVVCRQFSWLKLLYNLVCHSIGNHLVTVGPNSKCLQLTVYYYVRVVTAGRQLAKSLELQSLNDLGFSKRYVRCLQVGSCFIF